MDINGVQTFISTLGFPIAVASILLFFCWKMWTKISEKLDQVTETNSKLVHITESLILSMSVKIENVDKKIDNLIDTLK